MVAHNPRSELRPSPKFALGLLLEGRKRDVRVILVIQSFEVGHPILLLIRAQRCKRLCMAFRWLKTFPQI